jgi:hypothetical protein
MIYTRWRGNLMKGILKIIKGALSLFGWIGYLS